MVWTIALTVVCQSEDVTGSGNYCQMARYIRASAGSSGRRILTELDSGSLRPGRAVDRAAGGETTNMINRGLVKTRLGYIHYRRAGIGAPVMLFHINQQSSALMIELIEALAPHFDAIAMDYPSHGMSDHVPDQPTIPDYAQVAVELMDALGVSSTFVLGEAVGSLVAAEMASAHAERVHKAMLVNCPYLPGIALKDTAGDVTSDLRPSDVSGFPMTRTIEFVLQRDPAHAPMAPTQSWMDRVNVAQIEAGRDRWQALNALRLYDLGTALERIRCPVTVLMGEFFYFGQYVEAMMQRLPGARRQIVPGGRFCMTWEKAAEIGAEALRFFEEV